MRNHGLNRAERYIETLHDITCRNLTGKENMAFVSITCVAQLVVMSNEYTSYKNKRIFSL